MEKAAIARKIDKLGRIVIPMEARRNLNWNEREFVEIRPFGQYILLRSAEQQECNSVPVPLDNPIQQEIKSLLVQLPERDLMLVLNLLQRLSAAATSFPANDE